MDKRHAARRLTARWMKSACGEASSGQFPLLHPLFNLREVAKQMLLLEDHLQHLYKHCPDCIRKHLMTIEAFAEEATTLDKAGVYRDQAEGLAEQARRWLGAFEGGSDLAEIAQEVRKVRKVLVALVSRSGSGVSRVAARFVAVSTPCPHRRLT